MPERSSSDTGAPVQRLAARGAAPLSFTALSPPEQGDAVAGLTLAVAGVGPAASASLPRAVWPDDVREGDAWAVAVDAETGWCVLLSQDCDIDRDPADEPTVSVAPLVFVPSEEWDDLDRNGYSPRRYAYPSLGFELPDGQKLAVDLAWATSVLKGSLHAPSVSATRPFTGPQKAAFGEWAAARNGRIPFPDDVVRCVLDPCYEVRKRLASAGRRAEEKRSTATIEARVVRAVSRWYAHHDGRLVTIFGELSGPGLQAGGFVIQETGEVDDEAVERARVRFEAEIVKRMHRDAPGSGFQVHVTLADLMDVPAGQFVRFALLLR